MYRYIYVSKNGCQRKFSELPKSTIQAIPLNNQFLIKLLDFEQKIETEYFQGRYDIKLKWNDKIYIMDFKNNAKAVYFENKLQLIAYSMGMNLQL